MTDWFATPLALAVHDAEAAVIQKVLPARYYENVVDIGPGHSSTVNGIESGRRVNVTGTIIPAEQASVVADMVQLPFAARTADLMLLRHSLEFSRDPRQVLREVTQILAPEGCIVICGFNPVGLWGIAKLLHRRKRKPPWSGRYLSLHRINDWLSLLQLDLIGGGTCFYRPPLQSSQWRDGLVFVERMGERWWPALSGSYVVVARKRNAVARVIQKEESLRTQVRRPRLAAIAEHHGLSSVVIDQTRASNRSQVGDER